jgi:hypothetical protein
MKHPGCLCFLCYWFRTARDPYFVIQPSFIFILSFLFSVSVPHLSGPRLNEVSDETVRFHSCISFFSNCSALMGLTWMGRGSTAASLEA